MSKEESKSISTEVSKEVWKKLKIVSVQKEISLPALVKDILERSVSKKSIETEES